MAGGVRVLVSGMGGELGCRVASLLEDEPWVGSLEGIDVDPPRYRLRRARFHRIAPGEHDRIVDAVTSFNPHVVVHVAVWEPYSRASPPRAAQFTEQAATSFLGAAAECRALEALVVRSGIEVYGRRRGSLTRPDESAPVDPTSDYGRTLAEVESTAAAIGSRVGASVASLRLASVLGPHVPSPLGRLLRMPAVPFSALANPPFAVVHLNDAARAFVAAAVARFDGPLNIVGSGAITVTQAVRRGRRIPVPMLGPEWPVARRLAYTTGAPVPDHVQELFHRGRLADNHLATEALGFTPAVSTREVIDQLYAWPDVVHVPAQRQIA